MQLVGVQVNTVWENKPVTHARVRRLLDQIEVREGALVVLPEMFATGFSLDVAKIDDEKDSESQSFLSGLAADLKAYVLGGVVISGPDGKGCNQATAYAPDGDQIARYHKIYPFTFGKETEHYGAGCQLVQFPWHEFTVAPFICYDLRFPEVFRCTVRQGAHLFPVIANWPAARQEHWMALLKARAIENQAYVIGVNRCGNDPNLAYTGRSQIVDPRGQILADAGEGECVIYAEVELGTLLAYRQEFPALADMRPEYLPKVDDRCDG